MNTELATINVEEVRAEVRPLLDAAKAVVVADETSYNAAMECGAECARRARHIEDVFRPSREAAHKTWKTITATVASFVTPLDEARKLCTGKGVRWRQKEEEVRRAAQRAVEEQARKDAEEARLQAAITLEQAGAAKLAQRVLDEPIKPVPVEHAAPIRSEAREIVRQNWQVEVTDFSALVRAVAAGTVDPDVLQPCMTVLRVRAKAMREHLNLPGVRVWDEGSVAFGR